jgi:anti-anti-sigma factor
MTECSPVDYAMTPEGRLDALTAPDLDARLRALPDGARRIIAIDLSKVTYVSSSGLRVLLIAHRRQQQGGGRLLVRHPAPKVWQVIQLCGFDQILDVCA